MRSIIRAALQSLVCVALASGSRARAADLSGVLEQYRSSCAQLASASMCVTTSERRSVRGGPDAVSVTTSESVRATDRAFCVQRRTRTPIAPGVRGEALATESSTHWLSDGRLNSLREAAGKSGAVERTLRVASALSEPVIGAWRGNILSGYLPGDGKRIDVVLEDARARLRLAPESVDGTDCFVVDAVANDWSYSVWFAPSRGGAILKVVRRREGELLARSHQQSRDASTNERLEQPVRITQVVDAVQVEQIDGNWVPIAGNLTETIEYAQGPPTVFMQTVERTNVDLNPRADSVPAPPVVPNGTRVELVGQTTPFIHEWRDGQVVPREDTKTTATLQELARNRRFAPYAGEHGWLRELRGPLLLGAPAVAVLVVALIRRGCAR